MIYCARVRSENYTSAGNTVSFSDDITLGRCSRHLSSDIFLRQSFSRMNE